MSQENVEIVRPAFEACNRRDIDADRWSYCELTPIVECV